MMVGLLASLLASALLIDPRSVFFLDWNNHLWFIEYFGESLKHFFIPSVINTKQIVGMPDALFYAQKFYVLMGMVSAFLGSALTIRLMIGWAFLIQFFHVYRAALKAGAARHIAIGVAVFVTWAIYPLTNLYNRSALTEFFAVIFLTCAVCSFLAIIIDLKHRPSRYDLVASGYFFVLAAITHPLTALWGGLFLAILGVIALFTCEGERKWWFGAYFSKTLLFSLLILSPWIYLVAQFNDKLPISSRENNAKYFHSEYFFPRSIDNGFSRLSPFPLDLKSLEKGVQDKDTFTPYIDAQVTLPLILLIGIFFYIFRREKYTGSCLSVCEKAIIVGSAGMLVMVFVESICPKTFDWLAGVFNVLQFPYRLVTYINLSALVIVILLAGCMGRANLNRGQLINICVAFCVAISFSALIQKLVHASAIEGKSTQVNQSIWAPRPFRSVSHLNELPTTYYGLGAYTVKEGFEKGTVSGEIHYIFQNFNVLEGDRFGQVEPLMVNLTAPTLVITNVQAFPWNQILINGSAQYPYSVIVVGGRGAVLLPAGNYHLEFATHIDPVWRLFNLLSWMLFIGWMVLYKIIAFKEIIRER